MSKTYKMFAAVNDSTGDLMCVNFYANSVRKEAGEMVYGVMTIEDGWKSLMKEGWRVRPVTVKVRP